MNPKLQTLKQLLLEADDLKAAAAVLSWDQLTHMPPGGGPARARQLATLERLAHEKFIDPAIGKLLDDLRPYEESLPYDSDEASLIRVTRRDYEHKLKLPPAFVAEYNQHFSNTYEVWAEAKPANDFARLRPYLEKTVELSRRYSDYQGGYDHIADPLIDRYDYGMKAAALKKLFGELREQLLPLVKVIAAQTPMDDSCVFQHFPQADQLTFAAQVVKQLGYDFNRGRQDLTLHPFETMFSVGDVRITTKVNERDVRDALYSNIHESGHAMYDQGCNPEFEGTPLAGGTSAGVHESQSRLWENVVGRSRGFWDYFYPRIQTVFPAQLKNISEETFYRAVNKVERSLLRLDADEVTYNLHIMLRLDFEMQLLEGSLSVRDLPEAWHERMEADFGIAPKTDTEGVMQDVHWFADFAGGVFQGYTLGNLMSAQFYEAALKAHPEIPEHIRQGNFATLHGWLKANVYWPGSKFTADELLVRATGQSLTIAPYIRYLQGKYGELYKLSL
jgi:carboxypeptidase Taq